MNVVKPWFFFVVFITALALWGCKQSYEEQAAELEQFVAKNQIGRSPDYFLTKNGNDRLAVIYGLADDFTFCADLADLYAKKYPADHYGCVPAQR